MARLNLARWAATAAASLFLMLGACAPTTGPTDTGTPPKPFVIFFLTDSAALTSEALVVLDRVAEEVQRIKATGVGIVGYSGSGGPAAANLRLSEQRSAEVETALLARQVPPDIIVRTYHGATATVAGPPIEGQRVEVVVSRETTR